MNDTLENLRAELNVCTRTIHELEDQRSDSELELQVINQKLATEHDTHGEILRKIKERLK